MTIKATLCKDGLAYQTPILMDSGANGYAFIDRSFLRFLRPALHYFIKPLPRSIPVRGYNGQEGEPISHYVIFTLVIDHRIQSYTPFLITSLGAHKAILGRTWLSEHRVKLDCYNRRLDWPSNYPPTPSYRRLIYLDPAQIKPNQINIAHQNDMYARDRRIDAAYRKYEHRRQQQLENRIAFGEITCCENSKSLPVATEAIPVSLSNSHQKDTAIRTQAMNQALHPKHNDSSEPPPLPLYTPSCLKRKRVTPPLIDIAAISGPAFNLYAKRKLSDEIFTTSLYEIDILLAEKQAEKDTNDLLDSVKYNRKLAAATLLQIASIDDEPPVPPQYADYADVFSKAESNVLPPHRSYDHKIILEGDGERALKYSPLYKMSLDELEAVKAYILDNLDKGFIEPSQAPFAAPILFVKKPNGGLRLCIDYRTLNALTRKDRYPLPLIDETLARITHAKIFTKLDIRQAFHRIRMDPDSEELTTFRTRYGAYKMKVLPFGLTNGPATYQRYMNEVLFDYLDIFCTAYLDDILIYSNDPLEHEYQVKLVLERLRNAGLQADIKKCEFNITKTKYLGFIISTEGIEVDPAKVDVVRSWQYPSTVRGIQSFLGFCNFYRRFIKRYGVIAKPLVDLTRANVPFRFDSSCAYAFDTLKAALTSAPLLQHYDPELECMLETDASDGVVACVLSQKHGEDWLPVAYYSKTMAPAELNYEVHDKEMLAIIKGFKNWRAELTSTPHQIRVFTDHKALEYFMTSKTLNARQARWAELLADYNFIIAYRPGKDNPLADALTRRDNELDDQNRTKKANRLQQLIKDNQFDPRILTDELRLDTTSEKLVDAIDLAPIAPDLSIVARVLQANRNSKSLQPLRIQASKGDPHFTLDEGLLLYQDRLIVPDTDNLRTLLIREVHDQVFTAHPSVNKTIVMLSRRYYWRGISAYVKQYIRNCHMCRRSKVPRDKIPGLLHPLPAPTRPWEHVTMDYCSFNKDKHGYNNILVIIDRFSKQAITIPCKNTITTKEMAQLYIYHIYRYFGPPLTMLSDRGSVFISAFWKEFNTILGTQIKLSSTDHPQTDGQTEIYNQYLTQRLRPFVDYYQTNWSDLLPMMDYAQLTLPHDSLGGLTPFEVVHGFPPRDLWDWRIQSTEPKDKINIEEARSLARSLHDAQALARRQIILSQERMTNQANKHRREVDFDVGNKVWLDTRYYTTQRPSRKLDNPVSGPFKILEKKGHSYRLELPSSMKIHDTFPPEKLRKAADDPLPGQHTDPSPPINISGEEEWEVDDILASRSWHKQVRYRVSWLNHDPDPTFYPASNFMYAPHKLREFHLAHPTQFGPPALLMEWIKMYEEGRDDYDELADNKAMDESSRASFFRRGG